MEELEGQLGDGFYRCHRGYQVNMAHIVKYDIDSIFLSNGEKVACGGKGGGAAGGAGNEL